MRLPAKCTAVSERKLARLAPVGLALAGTLILAVTVLGVVVGI